MPLDALAVWLDALRGEPKQAVADLLSGRQDRGQFARLECAEFMQRALVEAGAPDEARAQLDEGLAAWLAEAMASDEEWRRREGLKPHLYRLNEAFAAVGLLDLPRTAYRLRELHPAYRRWLQGYDFGFGDGPYAGYWRALASTQQDAAPFRQQWHEFVVHAGEGCPGYLQQVGMAGLRRMPGDPLQRQLAMINALLRRAWRIGNAAALDEFAERLSALRAEYPMANDTWRGRVLRILQLLAADEEARRQSLPADQRPRDAERLGQFKARLGEAVRPVIGELALGAATAESIPIPALPSFDEGLRIGHALREPKQNAIAKALELFERHRAYAEVSGDSYFFVRTLCNLGHRVLKQAGLDARDRETLRVLLRHALVWEPGNPYPWSFWAEVEQAEGREDVAETVLWEAVRRFPEQEPSRVVLALLLQRRHAREGNGSLVVEAETLLREAVTGNPRNEPSRVELALLLQRRHAGEGTASLLAEAETLLREVVTANPRNSHSRTELARLLARNGCAEAARILLQEGLVLRDDSFWRRMLSLIEAGKPLALPDLKLKQPKQNPAGKASAPFVADELESLRANAAAARFAYARERGETGDVDSLKTAARQYELPRFYLGWFGEAVVDEADGRRLPYALAALAALDSAEGWQALERDYSQRGCDIALLKLYAGVPLPAESRAELVCWLEEDSDVPDLMQGSDDAVDDDGDDADEVTAPVAAKPSSYEDFLRSRLRQLDFLGASERTPGGLATPTRAGACDKLIEQHLARTIEADLSPLSLVA